MSLFVALRALVFAVWAAMTPSYAHVGDASAISAAIAEAVVEDGGNAPVYSSHAHDAALMAYWAARESTLNLHAVNDGHRSWGAWQEDARTGRADALTQARAWLWMLHAGARMCPEHPATVAWGACHARDVLTGQDVAKLAAQRETRARELLTVALGSF